MGNPVDLVPSNAEGYCAAIIDFPDTIHGKGMGPDGEYDVLRYEDIAFLAEAILEFSMIGYYCIWHNRVSYTYWQKLPVSEGGYHFYNNIYNLVWELRYIQNIITLGLNYVNYNTSSSMPRLITQNINMNASAVQLKGNYLNFYTIDFFMLLTGLVQSDGFRTFDNYTNLIQSQGYVNIPPRRNIIQALYQDIQIAHNLYGVANKESLESYNSIYEKKTGLDIYANFIPDKSDDGGHWEYTEYPIDIENDGWGEYSSKWVESYGLESYQSKVISKPLHPDDEPLSDEYIASEYEEEYYGIWNQGDSIALCVCDVALSYNNHVWSDYIKLSGIKQCIGIFRLTISTETDYGDPNTPIERTTEYEYKAVNMPVSSFVFTQIAQSEISGNRHHVCAKIFQDNPRSFFSNLFNMQSAQSPDAPSEGGSTHQRIRYSIKFLCAFLSFRPEYKVYFISHT